MTPEQIRDTLARHVSVARRYAPGGQLMPQDMPGLYRRTASECGVTLEDVKEADRG